MFFILVFNFLLFRVMPGDPVLMFAKSSGGHLSQAAQQQLTDDVKKQYAELDKQYMEQAVWAPYGNEQFTTFLSERMDFDKSYHHLLFNQDYSSFAIK